MAATPKKKRGRPTIFNKAMKGKVELMGRRGFSDAEICMCLGIAHKTFTNWKKKHKSFFDEIGDWKIEADYKVEMSLYERATGYSHPEDKIFNNNGIPMVVPTTKHYPPDTGAAIFWLKNRHPKRWRDKVDTQITGPDDGPVKLEVEWV